MKLIVTGGAGFIGSALIRYIIKNTQHAVLNIDKLTYAGNLESLKEVESSDRYFFEKTDINNREKISRIFGSFKPDAVMHLAAESHVDRSIRSPEEFIRTNINGTYELLEICRLYWQSNQAFRFQHISTDEVYGDLNTGKTGFTEVSPYNPSSPYSASKASADHLVRAWHRTFGLPTMITYSSNNYGPFHYPEKLIPLTIVHALKGREIPLYGNGNQLREWLHVDDHVRALLQVLTNAHAGETYNIGSGETKTNVETVRLILSILDELLPRDDGISYLEQITFTSDRYGHDAQYALDSSKMTREFGWIPRVKFDNGIRKTVEWYLENSWWWEPLYERQTSVNQASCKIIG